MPPQLMVLPSPEPKKTRAGLRNDRPRNIEGRIQQQQRQHVGQNVPVDNTQIAAPLALAAVMN